LRLTLDARCRQLALDTVNATVRRWWRVGTIWTTSRDFDIQSGRFREATYGNSNYGNPYCGRRAPRGARATIPKWLMSKSIEARAVRVHGAYGSPLLVVAHEEDLPLGHLKSQPMHYRIPEGVERHVVSMDQGDSDGNQADDGHSEAEPLPTLSAALGPRSVIWDCR